MDTNFVYNPRINDGIPTLKVSSLGKLVVSDINRFGKRQTSKTESINPGILRHSGMLPDNIVYKNKSTKFMIHKPQEDNTTIYYEPVFRDLSNLNTLPQKYKTDKFKFTKNRETLYYKYIGGQWKSEPLVVITSNSDSDENIPTVDMDNIDTLSGSDTKSVNPIILYNNGIVENSLSISTLFLQDYPWTFNLSFLINIQNQNNLVFDIFNISMTNRHGRDINLYIRIDVNNLKIISNLNKDFSDLFIYDLLINRNNIITLKLQKTNLGPCNYISIYSGVDFIGSVKLENSISVNSCTIGNLIEGNSENGTEIVLTSFDISSEGSNDFSNYFYYDYISNLTKVTMLDENYEPTEDVQTFTSEATLKTYLSSNSTNLYDIQLGANNDIIDNGYTDGQLFNGKANIYSVSFDEGITTLSNDIKVGFFKDCTNLTTVNLPNSLTELPESIFNGCTSLTSIELPENLNIIGPRSFCNCSELQKIECNEKLTTIGSYAFYYDKVLTSLMLPHSVTNINDHAFYGCGGLLEVELCGDLGSYAFSGCTSLKDIKWISGTIADTYAFSRTAVATFKCPPNLITLSGYVFNNCSELVSIELDTGITSVDDYCFKGCANLSEINIPGTIQYMSYMAISDTAIYKSLGDLKFIDSWLVLCPNTNSYTTYTIPDGTIGILSKAFYISGNTGHKITNITFNDDLKTICDEAFSNCRSITSISIPNSVTYIGSNAFKDCVKLETVKLSGNIESLRESVFSGCTNLQSIELPKSLTTLENNCFYGCSSLASIEIPSNVSNIGHHCFYNCSNLTEIIIPEGITEINNYCFGNCKNLTSITLPKTLTRIGTGAFYNCESLETINIPEGVETIESSAFYGCMALTSVTIPEGVKTIGEKCFYNCTQLTDISLPETLESIGSQALYYTALKSLIIPDSTNTNLYEILYTYTKTISYIYIGQNTSCTHSGNAYWMSDITDLKYIEVSKSNPYLSSIDGILYNKLGTVLYQVPNSIESVDIIIPEGVTNLNTGAFLNCLNIKTVTIPESVKTLGQNCFQNCESLISINIPDSVTEIPYYAFENCSELNTVELPVNLSYIKDCAFRNSGIEKITVPSEVSQIGTNVFENCTKLLEVSLPRTIQTIGHHTFSECTELTTFTWTGGASSSKYLKTIPAYMFYNCSKLTAFNYPNAIVGCTVQTIGDYAFAGCSTIGTFHIPGNLTSIGSHVFDGCNSLRNFTSVASQTTFSASGNVLYNYAKTKLIKYAPAYTYSKSFTIPYTVTDIEPNAFEESVNLITITFPTNSNMTGLNTSCFYRAVALKNITLPSKLVSIPALAFSDCISLESITIPETVTTINSTAFSNCENLLEINMNVTSGTVKGSPWGAVNATVNWKEVE